MKFTPNVARKLLSEIHNAIRQPVNLMDISGRIIASTDLQRVGTLHSAAREAIQKNMDCLIVRTDDEYLGSRIGINIPIHYEGEVIGVVGITGSNYDELSHYIHLIRTTTEALLKAQEGRSKILEGSPQLFLENILFGPVPPSKEVLTALEEQFGIRTTTRYCAAVLGLLDQNGDRLCAAADEMIAQLKQEDGTILACYMPNYIAVFSQGGESTFRSQLEQLQPSITARCGSHAAIGYCRTRRGIDALQQIFLHSKTACRVAQLRRLSVPVCYDDLSLEVLLPDIEARTRNDYLRKVFAGQPEEVCRQWRRLLDTFYRCDGSINRTAELLYVHKNTIQYQLRKIAEMTGFDPRSFHGAALFQMALMLCQTDETI